MTDRVCPFRIPFSRMIRHILTCIETLHGITNISNSRSDCSCRDDEEIRHLCLKVLKIDGKNDETSVTRFVEVHACLLEIIIYLNLRESKSRRDICFEPCLLLSIGRPSHETLGFWATAWRGDELGKLILSLEGQELGLALHEAKRLRKTRSNFDKHRKF